MYRNMLRKLKLILSSKICNLVQLLVSIFSSFWFLIIHKDLLQIFWNIIEKTTFEEIKKSANKFKEDKKFNIRMKTQ